MPLPAKATRAGLAANTFEIVGREWYAKTAPTLADTTKEKLLRRLEVDVFPWIGERPISSIMAADLIKVIERIEQRGAVELAKRVHNATGRIFRYAVGRGLASRDPSRDIELKDILPPAAVQHHASVTDPKEAGGLLRAIEGFTGAFSTRCALRLAALVFVRPGELRHAEWKEFNFEKAEWRIPAGKMKMKAQHIVPLSAQAIAILREIQPLTGAGRYVFPSERGGGRPMSENTINAALRRLGYAKDEMTGQTPARPQGLLQAHGGDKPVPLVSRVGSAGIGGLDRHRGRRIKLPACAVHTGLRRLHQRALALCRRVGGKGRRNQLLKNLGLRRQRQQRAQADKQGDPARPRAGTVAPHFCLNWKWHGRQLPQHLNNNRMIVSIIISCDIAGTIQHHRLV